MSQPIEPAGSTLPPALAARIDDLCDRFEAAWKDGQRPRLEEYLMDVPEAGRATAAWELVRVEAHYRRCAGEQPESSEYLHRVPMLGPAGLAGALTPVVREAYSHGPAASRDGGPSVPAVPGYELQGVLGRGGMGVVYKARQISLNRIVALKMIRTGASAGPAELSRFRLEAETAARLQHPNVVQIYEVGEWYESAGSRPQPYIALEYVTGGSLADFLRGTPQPPQAAAQFVETVARALAHVHAQGIIHRDLKPGNILMSSVDGPPSAGADTEVNQHSPNFAGLSTANPKITDFGLAKLGAGGDLTQTGDALGTPSYMAPEQTDGNVSIVGPVADIYSLGTILYETLTGRPPFRAETVLATVLQVRHDEPVPPRFLQPTVPRDLETICLKCLAKEPGRRYPSALDLAEDLGRFRAGEPIHARPVGAVERLGRWCRRKPAVAGLLGALAVAVVGGFAGLTALWLVADQNRQLAVNNQTIAEDNLKEAHTQRARAEDNFRLAQKAVDDFALKVSKDKRLRSSLRPLRKELLATAVQFYEQFVAVGGDDPRLRAELGDAFRRLGEIVREVDDLDKAITCYTKARDLFTELDRGEPHNLKYVAGLAACEYGLGLLYQETGRGTECEESCRRSIALLGWLVPRSPENDQYALELARCHVLLGLLHQRAGRYTPAETEHVEGRRMLLGLRADHPKSVDVAMSLAQSHNNLGMLYNAVRKRAEAEREYRAALTLQRQLAEWRPDEDDYQNFQAATGNNLGLIYYQERRYADAEREFTSAASINRALVARLPEVTQYHQFLAANCTNLGHVCRDSKRPKEAVAHYEEANAIFRRLMARQPQAPAFATDYANNVSCLGHILKAAGKPAEALVRFDEALQILEPIRQRGAANAITASALRNAHWRRADALDLLGRHPEAVQAWERAAASDDGSNRDKLRLYRARSLVRAGDHRSAIAAVEDLAMSKASDSDQLFEQARVYAIAAVAVDTDPALTTAEREVSARRFNERSLALVRASHVNGYFQNAERADALKLDKDFTALRQNAEFQVLLQALEVEKGNSGK